MGSYGNRGNKSFSGRALSNKQRSGKTNREPKRYPDPVVDYILNLQRSTGNHAVEQLMRNGSFAPLMNAGKVSAQEAKDTLNGLIQAKLAAADPALLKRFSSFYEFLEPGDFNRLVLQYKDRPGRIRSYDRGRMAGVVPGVGLGLLNALTDIRDLIKIAGPAYGNKFVDIWDHPLDTFAKDTRTTVAGFKIIYRAIKTLQNDPAILDQILDMVKGALHEEISAFLKKWLEENKTPFDQGYEMGVLSGILAGEIIGAVFGCKGLLKIGKASKLGKLAKIAKTAKFQAILDKLGLGFLKKIINKADEIKKLVDKAKVLKHLELDEFMKTQEYLLKRTEAFTRYKGGKAGKVWEKMYDTLYRNKKIGKITEETFQNLLSGAPRRFNVDITINGILKNSRRDADNVLGNVAREIKSGYLKLTPEIKTQILKDMEIMRRDKFKIEWHLFGGGETKVVNLLEKAGFTVKNYLK